MKYNKKKGEQLTKNDNLTFFHPKSNPISWHCPNRLKIFDLEYGRKEYPNYK